MFIVKTQLTLADKSKKVAFLGKDGMTDHKFEAQTFAFKDTAQAHATQIQKTLDAEGLVGRATVIKAPPLCGLKEFLELAKPAKA